MVTDGKFTIYTVSIYSDIVFEKGLQVSVRTFVQ
jgi:hypothetical protein